MSRANCIFVDGKTLNQIAEESELKLETVQHRYSRGIHDYEGLTKPTSHMENVSKHIERQRASSYMRGSGDRFMEKILEKDISITDISHATGIARSTIYAFVYENRDVSSGRLAKLCSYVGISTDYVLGLKGGSC